MGATHKLIRIEEHTAGTCSAADEVVLLLGNKWSILVFGAISQREAVRYNELQRIVAGISQRMLTLTLKKLEANGIVKRTIFPTVPPRVDYSLTPIGRSLSVPVKALMMWTRDNRPALLEARAAYASSR